MDVGQAMLLERARQRDTTVELLRGMFGAAGHDPDGIRVHFVEDLLEWLEPSDPEELVPVPTLSPAQVKSEMIELGSLLAMANATM